MANQVKSFNGVAIANIKNINGLTDANIKNINGQEFTGTIDIGLVTSYTQVAVAGNYGSNMTYDEDNNFVYVQFPRNGGGGGAVVGSFNSSNQNVDWGSVQTIESSNAFSGNSCDYDKYNNRVWTAWIGGGDNTIYARCGTIASDKSISWGTTLTIQNGYSTYSRYNQGLLQQGLAVDQSTGKCLVVWNNANDTIGGNASNHHPNGVILTVDTSDNSITQSSHVRLATGGSGQGFPTIKCHYDPDNTEWVAITDADGSSTGIYALRVTNSSGNPAAANQTQLTSNSGFSLQGDGSGDHNATNGAAGGRYGGHWMVYDTLSDHFIVASSTNSSSTAPKLFAFENTGSGINWDTTGIAVSHGTTISQSGKGGTIAYSHARNRFATHGQDGDEKLEIFSYDASGGFTSHNSSSLITISTDDDPFFRGGASMQDMSAFAGGATMIVGTDYDSRYPYYILLEMGG
ncbi:MAG: hypothetical protein Unbinned1068contig1000_24 [Prokaryotic dsDNA virus sp.]|nr:MAG: hypothetical protein Unbinned1068contig1000_24 [Prokaryotic dsDNA virus sp.]|tara:strand:- start:492 stop:1871 length:1380 start_codon:yes stop_codon:yes gene_type:complete